MDLQTIIVALLNGVLSAVGTAGLLFAGFLVLLLVVWSLSDA